MSLHSSQALLQVDGSGHFRLSGTLDFASVPQLLLDSRKLFDAQRDVVVDLGGVQQSNSAGLALLLEWMRLARRQRVGIRFSNVPEGILTVAVATDLKNLLPLAS